MRIKEFLKLFFPSNGRPSKPQMMNTNLNGMEGLAALYARRRLKGNKYVRNFSCTEYSSWWQMFPHKKS